MPGNSPRCVFLNQAVGPLFRELVLASAPEFGRVRLYGSDSKIPADESVSVVEAPKYVGKSIKSRVLSWVNYVLFVAWRELFEQGSSLLFIVSNPPFAPVLGWLFNRLRKQQYALLFYDIYPEAIERFAGVRRTSFVSRWWRDFNRLVIGRASLVVTISPQLAATLSQYLPTPVGIERIKIVPTWVDTDVIRPIDKPHNPFAVAHDQVGKLTVLYAGNIGAAHDLDILPMMAEGMQDYPQVEFLVVSSSPGRQHLEEQCQSKNLRNVRFLPSREEDELPFLLATGDVGIVALATGAEGVSMPSKTYYAMAAGSALMGLSKAGSDLSDIIQRFHCGVNIDPENVQAAIDALRFWVHHPEELRRSRLASREAALTHFSRSVVVPELLNLMRPFID